MNTDIPSFLEYKFSFFVANMDVYSPLHGEDQTRKLRSEDSSVMMGGSEEAKQLRETCSVYMGT